MYISWVLVNYKTNQQVNNFIRNISNLIPTKFKHKIVFHIVDNSSDFTLVEMIENVNIKIYNPCQNLGYLGALNFLFKKKYIDSSDVIILSNTDLVFNDINSFTLFIERNRQNCDILAPSIIQSSTGWNQNPHISIRPSKKRMLFYKIIFSNMITSIMYRWASFLSRRLRILLQQINHKNSCCTAKHIYAPHGSLIIFFKSYVLNGGNFSYPMTLFNEEIYIAEQCIEHNLNVFFDPSYSVIHNSNSTTGGIFFSNKKTYSFFKMSTSYVYDKYFK